MSDPKFACPQTLPVSRHSAADIPREQMQRSDKTPLQSVIQNPAFPVLAVRSDYGCRTISPWSEVSFEAFGSKLQNVSHPTNKAQETSRTSYEIRAGRYTANRFRVGRIANSKSQIE